MRWTSCVVDDLGEVVDASRRRGTPWIERFRNAGVVVDRDHRHQAEHGRLLHLAQRGRAVRARADDRDPHAGARCTTLRRKANSRCWKRTMP